MTKTSATYIRAWNHSHRQPEGTRTMTTATCTAPDATNAQEALNALIAVRDNMENLADQTLALVNCAATADDGASSLADRARMCEVPRSNAMRIAGQFGDACASAEAHLRRAEHALRQARQHAHRLADLAQETMTARK
jgi:hypothetical protein